MSRRLTDQDVRDIRVMRADGMRQQDIAERFGIARTHVSMIARGLRYPHLSGPIEKQRKYHRGW